MPRIINNLQYIMYMTLRTAVIPLFNVLLMGFCDKQSNNKNEYQKIKVTIQSDYPK
jgi:hypothetical protein